MFSYSKWILSLLILCSGYLYAPETGAVSNQSYAIMECADYDYNCPGSDLNWVTYRLWRRLQDLNWTGFRNINDDVYPVDFLEGYYNSNWFDYTPNYGADTARVTVFAGHGSVDGRVISFCYANDGFCIGQFHEYIRLGTMAGDQSSVLILLSCCNSVLGVNNYNYENSKISQVLGFHSTAAMGAKQARSFLNCTDGSYNMQCWLDHLDNIEDTGRWNSPAVFSKSSTAQAAYNVHYQMSLVDNIHMDPAPESYNYYYYTVRDNGTTCTP